MTVREEARAADAPMTAREEARAADAPMTVREEARAVDAPLMDREEAGREEARMVQVFQRRRLSPNRWRRRAESARSAATATVWRRARSSSGLEKNQSGRSEPEGRKEASQAPAKPPVPEAGEAGGYDPYNHNPGEADDQRARLRQ